MALPPPEAYRVVPVTKRYWWPHPKARFARTPGPWWKPSSWYVDWVVDYRYFVYDTEIFLTEVPPPQRKPFVEFLDKPTNRQSPRDESFTFVKPEKEKKP